MGEPPFTSLRRLLDEIPSGLVPFLDCRFAFFGHSMGAKVAYATACELHDRGLPWPSLLVVSGHRAPDLPHPLPHLHCLSDAALRDALAKMKGTPQEALDNPELMRLILPTLRADVALCETACLPINEPIDVPLTAMGGEEDAITVEELGAWQRATRGRFRVATFPGGHFFLHHAATQVWRSLSLDLLPLLGAAS
jgi:medium-chain acyl-[acyl-carrier-protein] hydrolase